MASGSQQASVETLGNSGLPGVHEKGMLSQEVTLSAGKTHTLELFPEQGHGKCPVILSDWAPLN